MCFDVSYIPPSLFYSFLGWELNVCLCGEWARRTYNDELLLLLLFFGLDPMFLVC